MENINTEVSVPKKKNVSYSQFGNWFNCPHRWYLDFVKGLRIYDDNINTCFGTAIHEAVQLYIETLYKQGAQEADSIDMRAKFKETFDRELAGGNDEKKKKKPIEHTEDEYMEFSVDGDDIITAFTNISNRMKHFPSNKYEFVAIEDEIIMPIRNNIDFICYIDVVLKEKQTGRYRIIDIKTSGQGWNHYQKEDESKIAQILLYKAFFSRKYNIPVDLIDVEFLILKRKLYEKATFPQSRIQLFIPKHNQKAIVNTLNVFGQFVTECFKPNGKFNEDLAMYPKIPGKNKKHCKYCPHKKVNCDAKADVSKEEME